MRYDQNDRESSNVEDRRGEGGGGFRFPGGGRPTAKQVSNAFRLAERARQLWLNQRGKV